MSFWKPKVHLDGSELTRTEYEKFNESLHTIIQLKNVEIQELRARLDEARTDRDFYRTELFKLKGIGQETTSQPEKLEKEREPLNTRQESWTSMRRRLEREDLKRAAKIEIDFKEQQLRERNKKAEEKEGKIISDAIN